MSRCTWINLWTIHFANCLPLLLSCNSPGEELSKRSTAITSSTPISEQQHETHTVLGPIQAPMPITVPWSDLPSFSASYEIIPDHNVVVTALGGFFAGTQTVSLYEVGVPQNDVSPKRVPLAIAEVQSEARLSYAEVPPVQLASGHRYWLVVTGNHRQMFEIASPMTAPGMLLPGPVRTGHIESGPLW